MGLGVSGRPRKHPRASGRPCGLGQGDRPLRLSASPRGRPREDGLRARASGRRLVLNTCQRSGPSPAPRRTRPLIQRSGWQVFTPLIN